MAKQIKQIPTLSGKDANIFIERMIKVENSKKNSKQIEISKKIDEVMSKLTICV
jgi:hypothetical protein